MRTFLLSTAATAALAILPAAAQQTGETEGATSDEYFGDSAQTTDTQVTPSTQTATASEDGMVTVTVSGVEQDGGEVYVALQTQDGFAGGEGEYTQTVAADGTSVEVTFEDVEPGEYAVAAFQDTDGDGDVTLGDTGPTEPWGFSGTVSRSAAPSFQSARIDVEGETTARVRLSGGTQVASSTTPASTAATGSTMAGIGSTEADDDDTASAGMTASSEDTTTDSTSMAMTGTESSASTSMGTTSQSTTATTGTTPTTLAAQDSATAGEDGMVTVRVSGVQRDAGEVYVALQTREGFASEGGEYTQTAAADGRTVEVTFEGVEPGEYAVAAFQDTDGDGAVTLGETGPTERWGFSGRVSRNAAPSFDSAMIDVDGDTDARVRLSGGTQVASSTPPVGSTAMTETETDPSLETDTDTDVAMSSDPAMSSTTTETDTASTPPRAGTSTLAQSDVTETEDSMSSDLAMDDSMTADTESSDTLATSRPSSTIASTSATPSGEAFTYRRSARLAETAVTADDFIGADLLDDQGEKLATVEDVILDEGGMARGVILATGGLFGIGQDYYAVDFDRVRPEMQDGEVTIVSALTEEDVERLREFDLEAFENDMGSLRLASEVRGMDLPLGEGGETARVEDVVMASSGQAEALVIAYDGGRYIAPWGDVATAEGDGGLYLDTTPEELEGLTYYEGRPGQQQRRGLLQQGN